MSDFKNAFYKLLVTIVYHGKGNQVLKTVNTNIKDGIEGGVVFLGKGTARNKILQFLELSDIRKEVVMILGRGDKIDEAGELLSHSLHMEKPNSAIAFSMKLTDFIGRSDDSQTKNIAEDNSMYKSIFIVVEKGKGDDAVDIAVNSGAKGATIFNARGGSAAEAIKVFNIDIAPEKDVVLIVAKDELTRQIIDSVNKELNILEDGTGIIFTMNADKVYGLRPD